MFRTELPLIPQPQQLPHSARVLTIGSCFAETIGTRLLENKVAAVVNPFGTVFNPLTACQLLRAAAGEDMDWQQHLVEARGRWQSYDLHATLGAGSPVQLLQQIQEIVHETGEFLRTADVVMLTLGTAFAYRLRATGELVSNCHKVPAEQFEKELLTPDEIINAVAETHAYLRRHNPQLRFILTVSPVRHLKDTLPLNAVSKSALRLACHYLSELLPDVSYFPAYELLLDDLRDYRFYADDMLHPSVVAQDYIWERFTRTYFDASFGRFKKEWHSLQQALSHRPLYAAAPEHRQFLEATLDRLRRLSAQADMTAEMAAVEQQLLALPLPPEPEPEPEPEDDEERIDIGEYAGSAAAAEAEALQPVSAEAETEVDFDQQTPQELPATSVAAEAAVVVDDTSAEAPKKKRRSRGGAKRTARKRAALEALAAQEAALAAANAEPTVAPALPPAASEAPATTGEAALAAPPEPAATTAETVEPAETTEAAAKPRKGRTAGQILADKKKGRPGRNRGRQLTPLYAIPAEAESGQAEEAVETVSTELPPAAVAPVSPTLPPAEASPTPTPTPEAAAPEPALPVLAPEAPLALPPASAEATPPPAPEPLTEPTPARKPAKPKAPAKPRAPRSKKAPAAPEAAPAEAAESTPAPAAAPKPRPARKKAAKPAPAVEAAPAPTPAPAAPETMPAAEAPPAAPKRRSRPPRKKPTAADDAPAV